MDKNVLNGLNPGEKAVDIQEYHWGKNGYKLVYKVTIYTCKSLLFTKYISKYEFPFYFESKTLAEEYIQVHDSYEIYEAPKYDSYYQCTNIYYAIKPAGVNTKKLHYDYLLICTDSYVGTLLEPGEIWKGYIKICNKKTGNDEAHRNFHYTEVSTLENNAAKEGTFGNTYSYKLQQVNG